MTPEKCMAMMLKTMAKIAEEDQNAPVHDCVLSVPAYFTDAERHSMLDAAKIVGLNVLRLMHDTTAAALSYGIYKTDLPADKPTNVVFLDMGNSDTTVSIVSFVKGKLTVLSTASDRHLGGRDFDELLVRAVPCHASHAAPRRQRQRQRQPASHHASARRRARARARARLPPRARPASRPTPHAPRPTPRHAASSQVDHFRNEWLEKHKVDAYTNPKAMFRLRAAADKQKKVLSANAQAPIAVESFMVRAPPSASPAPAPAPEREQAPSRPDESRPADCSRLAQSRCDAAAHAPSALPRPVLLRTTQNDIDVKGMMERDQFAELCVPLFDKLQKVIEKAFEGCGLPMEEIASVEVFGGSVRIPAVQEMLAKYFGKDVSKTLNFDECVAKGCALQCAMLSPAFKVRSRAFAPPHILGHATLLAPQLHSSTHSHHSHHSHLLLHPRLSHTRPHSQRPPAPQRRPPPSPHTRTRTRTPRRCATSRSTTSQCTRLRCRGRRRARAAAATRWRWRAPRRPMARRPRAVPRRRRRPRRRRAARARTRWSSQSSTRCRTRRC